MALTPSSPQKIPLSVVSSPTCLVLYRRTSSPRSSSTSPTTHRRRHTTYLVPSDTTSKATRHWQLHSPCPTASVALHRRHNCDNPYNRAHGSKPLFAWWASSISGKTGGIPFKVQNDGSVMHPLRYTRWLFHECILVNNKKIMQYLHPGDPGYAYTKLPTALITATSGLSTSTSLLRSRATYQKQLVTAHVCI
jgi:hypothetical protein